MRIINRVRVDARRRAILNLAKSILGPMYDLEKEDDYVRLFDGLDYPIHTESNKAN